ncbi:hypothetical protein ACYZUC_01770 [Pseudomonas sp. GT1P32]
MPIKELLKREHPEILVEHLYNSYKEIERNYQLANWKTSELDAGHFVETALRIIEQKLLGTHTPLSTSFGSFSQNTLAKFENALGHESYRILVPRTLYSVYCIRNKRGVGHIGEISPNQLDATYILHSTKWVLAEFVRLASSLSPDEANTLIHQVIERKVDTIWDDGETFMILKTKIRAQDKILLVLYKKDNLADLEVQKTIEYKNTSTFRKILTTLKKERLIDYTLDKRCKLSPLGSKRAEEILSSNA